MLFAVLFTDKPGHGDLRARHLQAHVLMTTDPFYTCGLRGSIEVLHWSKALDRKVLV